MRYSHLTVQQDGYQLHTIDHPEARRALRRKQVLWDGTCWRFAITSTKSVQSVRYEIEGFGTVHDLDPAPQPPAAPSNVMICRYGYVSDGPCYLRSDRGEQCLADAENLALYLTKEGLADRPVLLSGGCLYPNAETVRLYATAAITLPIGPWIDAHATMQRFGGQLCSYREVNSQDAAAEITNLLFADHLAGMLAASVAMPYHPAATPLRTCCADTPAMASAVEDVLQHPGDGAAMNRLRIVWLMSR